MAEDMGYRGKLGFWWIICRGRLMAGAKRGEVNTSFGERFSLFVFVTFSSFHILVEIFWLDFGVILMFDVSLCEKVIFFFTLLYNFRFFNSPDDGCLFFSSFCCFSSVLLPWDEIDVCSAVAQMKYMWKDIGNEEFTAPWIFILFYFDGLIIIIITVFGTLYPFLISGASSASNCTDCA